MILYKMSGSVASKMFIVHVRQGDGYYHFHYLRRRDIIDDYVLPLNTFIATYFIYFLS